MPRRSHTICLLGAASLGALLAVMGCGAPDTGDIFGSSGSGGSASGSGGAGASGTGAASDGASSSGGESASGAAGSGAGSVGGGPSTGGASSGGSAVGGSGGAPPQADKLACGNQACPLGGNNACCWDEYELHAPPQAECVSGGVQMDNCFTHVGNDGMETRIECQLPSHCNSGLCCARREFFGAANAVYTDLECANACDWPDVTVCDPASPSCPLIDVEGQTVQSTCKPSELLPPGYYVCGLP